MSSRFTSGGLYAPAPLGVLLVLMACSSSEDLRPAPANADAGAIPSEGGIPNEPAEDAGRDAAELEPPPPYDFAVMCSSDPCVTQVAARGGGHACAVLQDGSVRCWGSNASGQLGAGHGDASAPTAYEGTPRAVLGVSNARSAAAAGQGVAGTTCVVSAAGDVTCFGSDAWGQLGRGAGGSQAPNSDPAPIPGLKAKSVTLANTFTQAIGTDDRLWSWGANDTLQLARDMSIPDAGSPTEAARADRVSRAVRSCAGTSKTGFVIADDGSLLSWGGSTSEQLGRTSSVVRDATPRAIAISDVSTVVTGAAHACALSRGRVHCWGENERGQLGTGRKADESLPARVVLPPNVYPVAVAAGGHDTCILAADGDVYCWGSNSSGQIGPSIGVDQAMPTRIGGLNEQAVALAVMDASICALLRGGSLSCWGDNLFGQLGRGSRDAELHPEPGPVIFK